MTRKKNCHKGITTNLKIVNPNTNQYSSQRDPMGMIMSIGRLIQLHQGLQESSNGVDFYLRTPRITPLISFS